MVLRPTSDSSYRALACSTRMSAISSLAVAVQVARQPLAHRGADTGLGSAPVAVKVSAILRTAPARRLPADPAAAGER